MSEEKKGAMIKVAEFYSEPTEGGGLLLSASADRGRLVLRPVEERKSEDHPDHELFLVERSRDSSDEDTPKDIRIGGMWKGKTQNGEVYYSGTFWLARCVAFRNSYREGPEDPEFILYVTQRQRKKAANNEEASATTDLEFPPA